LRIESSPLNGRVFDVCLDKGTYDAISLSPSNPEEQKAVYVQSSATLLKASGLLIIASCNWTEEELKKQFEPGVIMYKQKVMQQGLGVVIEISVAPILYRLSVYRLYRPKFSHKNVKIMY